jgi:hypothetical protein
MFKCLKHYWVSGLNPVEYAIYSFIKSHKGGVLQTDVRQYYREKFNKPDLDTPYYAAMQNLYRHQKMLKGEWGKEGWSFSCC